MGKSIRKKPKKKNLEKISERHWLRKFCSVCKKSDVKVGKDNLCDYCRKH